MRIETSDDEDVLDFAAAYGLEHEADALGKARRVICLTPNHDGSHFLSVDEAESIERETTHKWSQPKLLYFTIGVCSLGAIEQGWAQTGINGANIYIPHALGIDSGSSYDAFILGLINCILYLANALCGSWLAQPVNERLGRRGAIFIGSAICLASNVFSALSWSWQSLVASRLLLGIGLGLNGSTVAVFAAECAPVSIRGGLAVSWQMFVAFGIFLGFLANVAFYNFGENVIWRLQLGAPVVPTIPLLALVYLCPESPAWDMKRGRYDLAFCSLLRLRNNKIQAACEIYSDYVTRRKGFKALKDEPTTFFTKLVALFTVPRNRHALYASYTVMLSQQLCGINIIAFYSSTIFSSSGFSPLAALWASVIFGLVNVLGALPAISTMDSFGRRKLMLWTLPCMAVTMALESWTFSFPDGKGKLLALAGLVYLFCALYSPGVGPVPVAYSAEIYPSSTREVGMSFAVSTANMWATILSVTFPLLLQLGESASFGIYALLNVVAWVLCWTFVRESAGIGLEDMDRVFEESAVDFAKARWAEGMAGLRQTHKRHGWVMLRQDDEEDD